MALILILSVFVIVPAGIAAGGFIRAWNVVFVICLIYFNLTFATRFRISADGDVEVWGLLGAHSFSSSNAVVKVSPYPQGPLAVVARVTRLRIPIVISVVGPLAPAIPMKEPW